MKVDVYKNLHKDCFSVRSREYHNRGRVVAHGKIFFVSGVEFAVQPAGRQKVLEEKKKNVHAFVRGTLVNIPARHIENILEDIQREPLYEVKEVTYNPYTANYFFARSNQAAVYGANWAILKNNKVYACGLR